MEFNVGEFKCRTAYSSDLFDALFRSGITGLPDHIMKMSVHLNITDNVDPFILITRALTDADGNLKLCTDDVGSVLRTDEKYMIVVEDGSARAIKDDSYLK